VRLPHKLDKEGRVTHTQILTLLNHSLISYLSPPSSLITCWVVPHRDWAIFSPSQWLVGEHWGPAELQLEPQLMVPHLGPAINTSRDRLLCSLLHFAHYTHQHNTTLLPIQRIHCEDVLVEVYRRLPELGDLANRPLVSLASLLWGQCDRAETGKRNVVAGHYLDRNPPGLCWRCSNQKWL
jgi:hypothetical protein